MAIWKKLKTWPEKNLEKIWSVYYAGKAEGIHTKALAGEVLLVLFFVSFNSRVNNHTPYWETDLHQR